LVFGLLHGSLEYFILPKLKHEKIGGDELEH
jgi:hypothetical protein